MGIMKQEETEGQFVAMIPSPEAFEPKLEDVRLLSEEHQHHFMETPPEIYEPSEGMEGYGLYIRDPYSARYIGRFPSEEEAEEAAREQAKVRVRTYVSPELESEYTTVREATPEERLELWDQDRLGFAARGRGKILVAKFPEKYPISPHRVTPLGKYVEESASTTLSHEFGHLRKDPWVLDVAERKNLGEFYEEFAASHWALMRAKTPLLRKELLYDLDLLRLRAKREGLSKKIIKKLEDLAKAELRPGKEISQVPKEQLILPGFERIRKRRQQ